MKMVAENSVVSWACCGMHAGVAMVPCSWFPPSQGVETALSEDLSLCTYLCWGQCICTHLIRVNQGYGCTLAFKVL